MNEDELERMKKIMDGWQDKVMLSKRDCMMIIGFIGLFVLIIVSCCCMMNKNKININEGARNIYRPGYPKSILRKDNAQRLKSLNVLNDEQVIVRNPHGTAGRMLQLERINKWESCHVTKRRLSDELFGRENEIENDTIASNLRDIGEGIDI